MRLDKENEGHDTIFLNRFVSLIFPPGRARSGNRQALPPHWPRSERTVCLLRLGLANRAIEAGKKPPVIEVGNLEVVTGYCDVRDVVKAYTLLLKKGKKAEVYYISSGRPISLKDILNILIKEARVKEAIKIKKRPNQA